MRISFLALLKQHRVFLAVYLLFLLLAFLLMVTLSKSEIFMLINGYYNNFFDVFFIAYTWVGNGITMMLVGVGLLFVKYRYALLTLWVFVYTSLVGTLIKRLVNEPRPVKYFERIHSIRIIEGQDIYQWYSFPSGHGITAFALATVLAFLLPAKFKKHSWILVFLAALAAFSRIYLSQHFLQDVVAGSAIGVFLSWHLIWLLLNSKWYHSTKLEGRLLGGK